MIKRVTIRIRGRVHKVGFKFAAIDKVLELGGIVGTVHYDGDDLVVIEAQGEVDTLKELLRWCKVGPEGAIVKQMDYESSEELKNFESFTADNHPNYRGDND
jgi:acylphosphatase